MPPEAPTLPGPIMSRTPWAMYRSTMLPGRRAWLLSPNTRLIPATSCGFVLGGYTGDDGCGIGLDNRGDAYICGDFNDSLKFGDTVLYNTYSERYFVAKFSCDAPLFQGTTKQLPSLQLFPNPTNYSLTIKIANSEFSSVIIENLLGQILLEKPIESSEMSVNVADFPSGMYLITFKGANEHVVKKFVKQ